MLWDYDFSLTAGELCRVHRALRWKEISLRFAADATSDRARRPPPRAHARPWIYLDGWIEPERSVPRRSLRQHSFRLAAARAKTLTPVENLLRATAEKESPWFETNTPLPDAMTGHGLPGWILPFRFLPKPRPKRRRKPSDVSGLPLSPRLGWGQEDAIRRAFPLTGQEERRERELEKWVSK
ncbi:UNVERIFIED_ORG: hypothetical protein GGD48_002754 [Rhizobium etli]